MTLCLDLPGGEMAGMNMARAKEEHRGEARSVSGTPRTKRSWAWMVLAVMAVVAALPWIWPPAPQEHWVVQSLPLPPQPLPYESTEPVPVAEPIDVTLTASAKTWVEVQAGQGEAVARFFLAGEKYSFKATAPARILVGNAGGAVVSLNGKEIGPIGEAGAARIINIRPEGVEILPVRSAS